MSDNFHEEFPSFDIERDPEARFIFKDEKLKKYIQKHCLDRKRLKNYIKHELPFIGCDNYGSPDVVDFKEEIIRELKL